MTMGGKRITGCFPALAVACLSACAAPEPAALAPQLSTAQARPPPVAPTVVTIEPTDREADEPVCRRQTVTGSHRPRVVCQTAAERRATREAAQEWHRTRGRTGEISAVPVVPGP
jgi:hypothetical protein